MCNYLTQNIFYIFLVTLYIFYQYKTNGISSPFRKNHQSILEMLSGTYIWQSILGLTFLFIFFMIDKKGIFSFLLNLINIDICN